MTAIYARQSVDKTDSVSIETQIARCRSYAQGEVQVYSDKGFSGKNTNRPDFQRMMEGVRGGKIEKIVVYRLDRFSRSIADFSQLWAVLEENQVEFLSATENFDTASPMGRAMLNIILVFAQLERETTAQRVRDNYRHRFALGAWPGGPAPYGFSLGKTADELGRPMSTLIPNDHAGTVLRMFEEYIQDGMSLRKLAAALNREGIPGPKRPTWDNVTLSRILRSPLYVRADEEVYWWYVARGLEPQQEAAAFDGRHACNLVGRREGGGKGQAFSLSNHEGMVPARLWLACQEKLAGNRQVSADTEGKNSWLTGLLKCGRCGYAVKVVVDRRYDRRYLICSGRANMACCQGEIRVKLEELEGAVAETLRKLLAQCPGERLPDGAKPPDEELEKLERQIERLVQALAESSAISAGYVSRRIDALHCRRQELLEKQARERQKGGTCLRVDFDRASLGEKNLIAREFIKKIRLNGDEAEVIWKV